MHVEGAPYSLWREVEYKPWADAHPRQATAYDKYDALPRSHPARISMLVAAAGDAASVEHAWAKVELAYLLRQSFAACGR